jgi:hypothetical protein
MSELKITAEEIASAIEQKPTKKEDKMTKVDYELIATRNKKTVEEVKPIVDEFLQEIMGYFPGEDEEFYTTIVYNEIDKKFYTPAEKVSSLDYAKQKSTEHNVIILGVSGVDDANADKKRSIRNKYSRYVNKERYGKVNPDYNLEKAAAMIEAGQIEVIKGSDGKETWHVLDDKKTFGSKGENPNYGKPLEYIRERELYGVDADGKVIKLHGAIGLDETVVDKKTGKKTTTKAPVYPDIGVKCSVWGTRSEVNPSYPKFYDSVIKVWKDAYEDSTNSDDPGYQGKVTGLFELAEKLHEQFYISVYGGKDENGNTIYTKKSPVEISDVAGMSSIHPNNFFVVRGYIGRVDSAPDGKSPYITVKSEVGDFIKLSTSYEPVVAVLDDLGEGDEVIVLGEKKSFKTDAGDYKDYNSLMGVFKNNKVNKVSEAQKRYHELMKKQQESK